MMLNDEQKTEIDALLKTQADGENVLPIISYYFGEEGTKYAVAQQSVQMDEHGGVFCDCGPAQYLEGPVVNPHCGRCGKRPR